MLVRSLCRSRTPLTRCCAARLPTARPHRGVASAAVTEAAASAASVGPTALIQDALVHVQLVSGLPWWATIAGSAVALRVAILPTVLYQLSETRRFVALRPRFARLRAELSSVDAPAERAWRLVGGIWRICRSHGVQPLGVFALPLLQVPLLLGLVLSVRRMLLPGGAQESALQSGGFWWFADLTAADGTKALPVLSLLILLANVQHSTHGSRNPFFIAFRNVLQARDMMAGGEGWGEGWCLCIHTCSMPHAAYLMPHASCLMPHASWYMQ